VHRLSADNGYQPIIGQFADNRYRPFDNRHWLIIGRLFVLVNKTTKNAFNCSSHWWEWGNEWLSNQSRIIFNIQQNKVKTKV